MKKALALSRSSMVILSFSCGIETNMKRQDLSALPLRLIPRRCSKVYFRRFALAHCRALHCNGIGGFIFGKDSRGAHFTRKVMAAQGGYAVCVSVSVEVFPRSAHFEVPSCFVVSVCIEIPNESSRVNPLKTRFFIFFHFILFTFCSIATLQTKQLVDSINTAKQADSRRF